MEFKRNIKCSNCGIETTIFFSSQLALSELLIHGKCESCGNTLQLNYNLVGNSVSESSDSVETPEQNDKPVSLDMFNEDKSSSDSSDDDNTSDTIKDLIES